MYPSLGFEDTLSQFENVSVNSTCIRSQLKHAVFKPYLELWLKLGGWVLLHAVTGFFLFLATSIVIVHNIRLSGVEF